MSGTHAVRQFSDITLNAAPLPSGATTCMPNGQYNPSTGLSGACSFNANQVINQQHCTAATGYVCYNTGGITMNEPIFSSNYNALQAQLTRNAGHNYQYGVNYTWSHAFDDADNGAGSGSSGPAYAYPGYFNLNRSQSGYDRTNNLQVLGNLPACHSAPTRRSLPTASTSAIFGGFQLTGQLSHISGAPFTVSPSSISHQHAWRQRSMHSSSLRTISLAATARTPPWAPAPCLEEIPGSTPPPLPTPSSLNTPTRAGLVTSIAQYPLAWSRRTLATPAATNFADRESPI